MEAISTLVKNTLPNYLRNLPVPDSLGGFSSLSGSDWLSLVVFGGAVSFMAYATVQAVKTLVSPATKPVVNLSVKKDSPKVVDLVEIEELDKEKVSYCRCWRSSKFPYCDGTHNKHNEETGDNVGPVVVKTGKGKA